MLDDSFLCGFEPELKVTPKKYDKGTKNAEMIEDVFETINGSKSISDIAQELELTNKMVSYAIEHLKGKIEKIGVRAKSTIYKKVEN